MNTVIKIFSSLILITLLSSCTSLNVSQAVADANDPAVVETFIKEFTIIANEAIEDPTYKRIPLDSKADQDWFVTLAFLLWDDKVTTSAFMEEGLTRFPEYKESLEYVANKVNGLSKQE